jgi:hypothetical protein
MKRRDRSGNGVSPLGSRAETKAHTPYAAKPQVGHLKGGAVAVGQGASAGFLDELAGLVNGLGGSAAGMPTIDPQRYTEGRDAIRDIDSRYAQAHPKTHFAEEVLGSIPTAIAAPGGPIAGAAAYGAAAGAGGANGDMLDRAVGAGVGGAAGAALGKAVSSVAPIAGELAGRIRGKLPSRFAPKAGERVMADAVGSEVPKLALNVAPETPVSPAEQRAVGLLLKRLTSDKRQVGNLIEDASSRPPEEPVTLMELGGHNQNVRGLARGARSVPSRAKTEIPEALYNRAEQEPILARNALEGAAGTEATDPAVLSKALEAGKRGRANARYTEAYAEPPIDDPAVLSIFRDPDVQRVYRGAVKAAKRDGVALPSIEELISGRTAKAQSAGEFESARTAGGDYRGDWLERTQDPGLLNEMHRLTQRVGTNEAAAPWARETDVGGVVSGHRTGRALFERDGKAIGSIDRELKRRGWTDDEITNELMSREEHAGMADEGQAAASQVGLPMQGFDYVKRSLDDFIGARMRSGKMGKNEARQLRNMLGDALEKVDKVRPKYAEARRQFGEDAQLGNMVELGQNALTMDDREITRQVAGMTPEQRSVFAKSWLDAAVKKIRETGDSQDVYQRLFGNQLKRDTFKALLGDRFNEVESAFARGGERMATKRMVLGGSNTVDKAGEAMDLETGGIPDALMRLVPGGGGPRAAMRSLGQSVLLNRMRGLTGETADALSPMLTAGSEGGPAARESLLGTLKKLRQAEIQQAARRTTQRSAGRITKPLAGAASQRQQ